jgi:Putative beta-barrel porin-2, OmpL-like. bbp2
MFGSGAAARLLVALGLLSSLGWGQNQTQDPEAAPDSSPRSEFIWPLLAAGENAQQGSSQLQQQPAPAEKPEWKYGGFADIGYQHDFNYPSNHLFRSRSTTFHVNEVDLNMAALYLKKPASENSRWGTELTLQTGKDSEGFGFSVTAPNLDGSKWLRHLGPTDVSYLAPVGKGLTLQGGIFPSYIGYDSLYAKDNFNYTRPWGADFTPYLMLGVNAQYPFTARLTGTFFLISGYWHLAHANNVPSSGGQLAYKATDKVTLKETVLYGPHQSDTSLEFWRFLSDSIAEWKGKRLTTAFEYIVGTEEVASPGNPRALWMASQLPVHYAVTRRFSVIIRPEVYWDRDGRTTGFRQTVKANTTTFEYRVPYHKASAILWLEHRIDDSRGPEGGFFNDGTLRPGVVGLTPTQNLLSVGVILTFDSSFHH